MIQFFKKNIEFSWKEAYRAKRWIHGVLAGYGYRSVSASVIFCDDPFILDINRKFLGHDYYTDIITFDVSGFSGPGAPASVSSPSALCGELYISLDTVRANAAEYGAAEPEEFYRVLIHGFLHLAGFDDRAPEDAARMREAENSALTQLHEYGIRI